MLLHMLLCVRVCVCVCVYLILSGAPFVFDSLVTSLNADVPHA